MKIRYSGGGGVTGCKRGGGEIGGHFKDYGHFYSSMNFDENSDLGNLFGQKWLKNGWKLD